ncbi:MAG TPA: Fic family protein [Candidatus Cloacimonadota bacterium]|nr:Fic family protein [Candidatus Cloacimonadota bacterium]
MAFILKPLPPDIDPESKVILKKLVSAHRHLAELKGISASVPNQAVLINSLSLQEAKDSSAIENIITTHYELFKEELFSDFTKNAAAKEVARYVYALKTGYALIKDSKVLTNNMIIEIQAKLENCKTGFRKLPGTELKNQTSGETVYIPPQSHEQIISLMNNLEAFINDDTLSNIDPLIKMALIHYQFESIHPFYDGNGRTGRIINVLYLVLKDLLQIPVLYLSRYITRTKGEYYRLLQQVRDNDIWEDWILYILEGVEQTAIQTTKMILCINESFMNYKHLIRSNFKFYSHDLINNIFYHPYTKIEFLVRDLNISRLTASKYLDMLCEAKLLIKEKIGKSNYYVNIALYDILTRSEG